MMASLLVLKRVFRVTTGGSGMSRPQPCPASSPIAGHGWGRDIPEPPVVTRNTRFNTSRDAIIAALTDQAALVKVALESEDSFTSTLAVKKLTDQVMLTKIALFRTITRTVNSGGILKNSDAIQD